MELSRHVHDPNPIKTSVTAAFSDFRRTHMDNWAEDQKRFTEDQRQALVDVLVSPSYYVWQRRGGMTPGVAAEWPDVLDPFKWLIIIKNDLGIGFFSRAFGSACSSVTYVWNQLPRQR